MKNSNESRTALGKTSSEEDFTQKLLTPTSFTVAAVATGVYGIANKACSDASLSGKEKRDLFFLLSSWFEKEADFLSEESLLWKRKPTLLMTELPIRIVLKASADRELSKDEREKADKIVEAIVDFFLSGASCKSHVPTDIYKSVLCPANWGKSASKVSN